MESISRNRSGEQGSVLIVALVILVLLTIIGISATTTTNIETQIAGNEKSQKIAFYSADSGIPSTAKLISVVMDAQDEPDLGATVAYQGDEGALLDQIMGYEAYDDGIDVRFLLGATWTDADINRVRTEPLAGGGVEFAAGSEGVGAGTAGGGVAIFYDIDSEGFGPSNSRANIVADYRKVVGVVGGL
jgi:Tfp pilus assembly protein PilX